MTDTKKVDNSCRMHNPIGVIMGRELKTYFSSFVAYLVMFLFLLVSGFLLFSVFFLANRAELRQFFAFLPILFSLFVPALTMRLFAEESGRGTLETLLTLPVTSFEVVMGKFLASLITTIAMLAPTLIYAITAACFGKVDLGCLFCQYFGACLLAAAFCAIGLFASSLTKNQIAAFFIAFGICVILALIDSFLVFLPASVVSFLQFLSAGYHFSSISRGIIDTRDLVYFVSVSVLFIAATVKVLENRRRI